MRRAARRANRRADRRWQQRKTTASRRHPAWIRWTVYVIAAAVLVLFIVAAVQAQQVHLPPRPEPAIR